MPQWPVFLQAFYPPSFVSHLKLYIKQAELNKESFPFVHQKHLQTGRMLCEEILHHTFALSVTGAVGAQVVKALGC